jgi:uncharacterized protein YjeT (DUF2065 family)
MEEPEAMTKEKFSEYLRSESEELLKPLILKYDSHPSHILGVLGSALMVIGCQLKEPDIFKRMLSQMLDNVDKQRELMGQHIKDMEET